MEKKSERVLTLWTIHITYFSELPYTQAPENGGPEVSHRRFILRDAQIFFIKDTTTPSCGARRREGAVR
jgi:hypothetical protein